jgi:hypothetical protein
MKYKRTRLSLPLTILALLLALGVGSSVRAQQPNQVGLVVRHSDGSVITRCVEFGESEISGYDVLTRSGLSVVASGYAGMGQAICSIDGEGCPASDCFCECEGSTCVYWAYYHLAGGQWQYSNVGASGYMAHSGDVEGWAWGEGGMGSGAQPPVIPFDQICAPPATDTPVPPTATLTPVPPTATSTPLPVTATSQPPEAWFRLDQNPIAAGACTTVRWDTSRAREIYLDGESVALNGYREVCPAAPQTYKLRVVGVESETTYELVLGVTGATPSAATPAPPSPTVAAPSPAADAGGAGLSPSPLPSPLSPLASTPTPTPPAARMTPALSASPTPIRAVPSPTPVYVAQTGPTSAATDLPAASGGKPPVSPLVPLGYIVFSLVAGSLLGWLVFEMRCRR